MGAPAQQWSGWFSLSVAVAYGLSSLAMVFLNKAVLMSFPHSMSLLTLQMATSTVLIELGAAAGLVHRRPFNLATARHLLPLSLAYNANVAFSLASLKGVNIPMYIAIKRLNPMTVLLVNSLSGKTRPSTQVTLSVLTTTLGCLIAALGDFSFDPWGYGLALTSLIFQTAYLVLVERSGAEDGFSSFELMLYNAVLSLPFLSLLIISTGEASTSFGLLAETMADSAAITAVVVSSLVMGIVLNYTMFLCTIVNSALTTTIVGVLKGVGSTTLGFFILGGVVPYPLNIAGLVINTLGGVWYSVVKYRQKLVPRQAAAQAPESTPLVALHAGPQPAP